MLLAPQFFARCGLLPAEVVSSIYEEFGRSTGAFEMAILPGNYKAVIRATDGFMVEDEKRGRITPAKSLIPEKYSSSDDTDVTVTVSPTGGEVSIQLSSE